MPNDGYSQQRLAADPNFQTRVRSALANVAWQVLEEDPATPNHDARYAYAKTVINNLTSIVANSIVGWIVQRPNVLAFETTYNFAAGAVVSATGDADLQSQLMSDWDILASGSAPPPPPIV
jgi:hypothetical protein